MTFGSLVCFTILGLVCVLSYSMIRSISRVMRFFCIFVRGGVCIVICVCLCVFMVGWVSYRVIVGYKIEIFFCEKGKTYIL